MNYNGDMFFVASWIIKISYFMINFLRLGNGYTWPGHIINPIFPRIWKSPSLKFRKGVILISGTNGKTTTSLLVAHLLKEAGFSVTHNKSGANMLNGLLTSIFLRTDFLGRIKDDFAVFEVDEFNLPQVLKYMHPIAVVLTTLSRDQLDRYGETDSILERWWEALSFSDVSTSSVRGPDSVNNSENVRLPFLVLNSGAGEFASLAAGYKGPVLKYDSSSYYLRLTSLVGGFNMRNVNAAVVVAKELGIDSIQIEKSLPTFSPAFGRGEKINYADKEFYVFLAKNPASFNNNLCMLNFGEFDFDALLFILNDKIPDGRDVSWIYDIDPEALAKVCSAKKVYISGTRGLDMQVRLNYAGASSVVGLGLLDANRVKEIQEEKVVVLPNYSAMLEFRKIVTGKNIL